jgi:hypothetical protein
MTIRPAALFALLALGCATPVFAADAAGAGDHSDKPATQATTPPEERKICTMETATGSVMPKRVCRTRAEIEAQRREAERYRDQQNRLGGGR